MITIMITIIRHRALVAAGVLESRCLWSMVYVEL